MGDKTQLLALLLAARHRRPVPIILGILAATLANHFLAAWIGAAVTQALGRDVMRWILGLSFVAMAAWTLVPDKADNAEPRYGHLGVFGTTLLAFFLVEIGDKTQIATAALAARYASVLPVVAGTTLGMMVADVPAVYLGERILRSVPMRPLRWVAAAIFAAFGALALAGPFIGKY
jgi:Ca2+/H+ antiporter, TMEM165/GDT1 family